MGSCWRKIVGFYILESGGKKTIATKRLVVSSAVFLFIAAASAAWLSPNDDQSFYKRTTQAPKRPMEVDPSAKPEPMNPLFVNGQKQMNEERRAETEKNKRRLIVKYLAPQILGQKGNEPKAIKTGSKLVGFLMNAIDTREPSMVRVLLPQGGEASGVEIERGSVLVGQFNYTGSGDKVSIIFHRLDTASGQSRKIAAQALDGRDYSSGVRGEIYSDKTMKVASQIGLSMFAGMADVLTEKESLGFSQNGIQAKPTMKNGLLQGLSRAAQDQTGRTASEIQSMKDYVVIQEGKEMIIQLTEDFHK